MPNVLWSPQPKQAAFMSRPEYECLYGGAAGGGKSDALVMEALRQVNIPHYRGIIFRATYPQLEALISRSREIYPKVYPGATYNEGQKRWRFPSGACVFFGTMQHEDSKFNYQGRPYDFIGFDELTHFTQSQYMYLMSRNRPNGPGTRVYIRATANPGGIGHAWVKQRFIDAAPAITPIEDVYKISAPDGKTIEMRKKRIFIPSTVFDNQALLDNDPNYLATLAMLPEAERDALLYGDWNSFEGQVFREWRNEPDHYRDRMWTHVIDPFAPPSHWKIWRSFDFGYAKPSAIYWYAVSEDGKIYIIHEYYGCTGEPNRGVMMHPVEIARTIRNIEQANPMLRGKEIFGVADPSIFDESRGQSIAQMMTLSPNFIVWSKGDHTRLPGLQQFHYRFAFDENGECMLQVFSTCKHLIRTLPTLVYSQKNAEDVDTTLEDHAYDSVRYLLMENPISPRLPADKQMRPIDPLGRDVHIFR